MLKKIGRNFDTNSKPVFNKYLACHTALNTTIVVPQYCYLCGCCALLFSSDLRTQIFVLESHFLTLLRTLMNRYRIGSNGDSQVGDLKERTLSTVALGAVLTDLFLSRCRVEVGNLFYIFFCACCAASFVDSFCPLARPSGFSLHVYIQYIQYIYIPRLLLAFLVMVSSVYKFTDINFLFLYFP